MRRVQIYIKAAIGRIKTSKSHPKSSVLRRYGNLI
jgi:hypothetical protein